MPNIEVKDNGNIHIDGNWMTDVDADTTWLRDEAARFIAAADFVDKYRAKEAEDRAARLAAQPVWLDLDKYAGDEYA